MNCQLYSMECQYDRYVLYVSFVLLIKAIDMRPLTGDPFEILHIQHSVFQFSIPFSSRKSHKLYIVACTVKQKQKMH